MSKKESIRKPFREYEVDSSGRLFLLGEPLEVHKDGEREYYLIAGEGYPRDALVKYYKSMARRKLGMHAATLIRERHLLGDSIRSIAKDYGVTRQAVQKIVRGETYREHD
jgi:predicted transcriptional regulator